MAFADPRKAFTLLRGLEGGFVDHPDDPGGATKWGWTERSLRAVGYEGPVKDLTVEEAEELYMEHFWIPLRLGELHNTFMAAELLEQAVNFGEQRAVRFAQTCLNMLSRPVDIDGRIGKQTIRSLNRLYWEEARRWLKLMNGMQMMYYAYLSGWLEPMVEVFHAKQGLLGDGPGPAKEPFFAGWLRRVSLTVFGLERFQSAP